jgi:hypothetical protein
MNHLKQEQKNAFEEAGKKPEMSLAREFFEMLKHNKKYWMIPIVLILLGFGFLIAAGGSAFAPFIYTLF